ncbi:hypothetical protein GMMP15_370003 [Candidatus Magnetomoraceae bacterium gMMP-15]
MDTITLPRIQSTGDINTIIPLNPTRNPVGFALEERVKSDKTNRGFDDDSVISLTFEKSPEEDFLWEREQIEGKIDQLNNELRQLSQKLNKLEGAEFQLQEDEDDFYVVLADDDMIIKEFLVDDLESILNNVSGEARGMLLDLFF